MAKLIILLGIAASTIAQRLAEIGQRKLVSRSLQGAFLDLCEEQIANQRLPTGSECLCLDTANFRGFRCAVPINCLSGSDYEEQYNEACPGEICEQYSNEFELDDDGTEISVTDILTFSGDTQYQEVKSVTKGSDVVVTIKLDDERYECLNFATCPASPFIYDCSNIQPGVEENSCPGKFLFEKFSLCPEGGPMTPATDPLPKESLPVGLCFPGDSEVDVRDKGPTMMKNLALGDEIHVAKGLYEPVYSFGHKKDDVLTTFVQVETSSDYGRPLELSKDHMVFTDGGRAVPASLLKNGDKLQSESGESVTVTRIREVKRKGAFAPFTESGALVVNGIIASNYVAFEASEYLQIAGVELPVTYQWLAHTFNAPHRLAVKMGFTGESYTEAGISVWVDVPHKWFSALLSQDTILVAALLVPPFFLFGLLSLVETLTLEASTTAMVVVVASVILLFKKNLRYKTRFNKS